MNRIYLFVLFLLALLLYSCAEQRALEGGPKDTKPPRLDSSKYSTPNYQTNFKHDEIILTFNEWVQLKDAFNQVLVSPPLKEQPEIRLKRKSVIFRFQEPLRENTTYSIHFGTAVQDFTENNPAENIRFVFSTGPELDSLSLSGFLVDARTGKPAAKVGIHLYDNLEDSTPVLERPYYYTKTDDNGKFEFQNLKEAEYRIFALQDQNNNYLYDIPSELIAFHDSSFTLRDSMSPLIKMRLFPAWGIPEIKSRKALDPGTYQVLFSSYSDTPVIKPYGMSPADLRWQVEHHGDSTIFWWHSASAKAGDSLWLELRAPDASWRDTLRLEVGDRSILFEQAAKLRLAEKTGSRRTSGGRITAPPPRDTQRLQMHPTRGLLLHWAYPVQGIDTSKWKIESDSIEGQLRWDFAPSKPRDTHVFAEAIAAKSEYFLVGYPGAITSFFGEPNPDTIVFRIEQKSIEDYGNVEIKLQGLDSSKHYVAYLLKGKEEVEQARIQEQSEATLNYQALEPGSYSIQLLLDENKNGHWDSGNYFERRQPEVFTDSKATTLKANWDAELLLDISPEALKEAEGGRGRTGKKEEGEEEQKKSKIPGRGGRE